MRKPLVIPIVLLLATFSSAGSPGMANDAKTVAAKAPTANEAKLPLVSRDVIREKQDKITFINALDKKLFDRSHIKGSINIPYDNETLPIAKLLPDKKAEIVVYCMNSH